MYGTIAVNDIRVSNLLEEDYSLIYNEMSDEELEVAAQGLQASWGSLAGCRQHRNAAPHTSCDLAARRSSCFTQHQATSNSTYCKADITRA